MGTSVQQVIDATGRVTGREVPRIYVSRRAGDPWPLHRQDTHIKATLGWEPELQLDEIIATALRWRAFDALGAVVPRGPSGLASEARERAVQMPMRWASSSRW